MPSLSEELSQLESTLQTALSELENMKEKVHRLEAENAALIQKFSPYCDEAASQAADQMTADAHEALFKLYAEGYHVCHPAFGQKRSNNEDCLYCLGVLNDDDTL